MNQPITPPATPGVSPDALNSTDPAPASTQKQTTSNVVQTAEGGDGSNKRPSLKDKISNFAEQVKDDPSSLPDGSRNDPSDPGASSATTTPAVAPKTGEEPKDFKTLKSALDQRDLKVTELEAELAKLRPSATRVAELEADITAKQKDFEEARDFRQKTGLLNSDEFHKNIVVPRQHIANTIKAEFKADGIDEGVWELAQQATSRKQIEDIADEYIESNILKNQFFHLFFQDVELRKQEEAALVAPAKYLQQTRDAEIAHRNQTREMTERNFTTTWSQALADATDMATKLGENKLIETVELAGNTEHNEKVVRPILDAAHAGAEAMLKERIANGLPVTREDASRTVYLWRQAIAAQAANMDRMRWFKQSQAHEKTIAELTAKLETKTARNNPTPGSRTATGEISNAPTRGKNLSESISNFATAFKAGDV